MEKKEEKIFFWGLAIVIAILVLLIIKPVLNALLGGIILAVIFKPVHHRFLRVLKNNTLTSVITTILILVIIVVPLGIVIRSIVGEASAIYQYSASVKEISKCTDSLSMLCRGVNWIRGIMSNSFVSATIGDFFSQFAVFISTSSRHIITSVPMLLMNALVLFFSTFIFLKDGEDMFHRYKNKIPLKGEHRDLFVKRFKEVSQGVLYGTIAMAFFQAAFAAIGFSLFHVQAPVFWGFIVFLTSLFPFIAPPVVYLPVAALKIIDGLVTQNTVTVYNGIGIVLWGVLVAVLDTILRYKLTGMATKMHPLLVLIGIIGGVQLFGIVGVFFGPLVLVFALTLFEIYSPK